MPLHNETTTSSDFAVQAEMVAGDNYIDVYLGNILDRSWVMFFCFMLDLIN